MRRPCAARFVPAIGLAHPRECSSGSRPALPKEFQDGAQGNGDCQDGALNDGLDAVAEFLDGEGLTQDLEHKAGRDE
jgi:hypothetical protein